MIAKPRSPIRDAVSVTIGPAPTGGDLLPVPPHFDEADLTQIYSVDNDTLRPLAQQWAEQHDVDLAATDDVKVCLMLIDCQITFCNPDMPLFVTGDTGMGAVEDIGRICRYIYQNLHSLTQITCTLDSHYNHAIFHAGFWVNDRGEHPGLYTVITPEMVLSGQWRASDAAVWAAYGSMRPYGAVQNHAQEYVNKLAQQGRYPLIIWPNHARIGDIEHALVPSLAEAISWHESARGTDADYLIKGAQTMFEHYSAVGTEVERSDALKYTPHRRTEFIEKLIQYDLVICAGEAASHCFTWTIRDIMNDRIFQQDPDLFRKMKILIDGTSSVVIRDPNTGNVIPGTAENPTDFRPMAEEAFREFEAAGMEIITTNTPITGLRDYGAGSTN